MSAPRPPLSLRRRIAYAGILALLATTLLLLLAEGALRIVGYGYPAGFARRVRLADGTLVHRENRWCTAAYFSPELVRRPQAMRIPVRRAPRTFRVFILGSSAAMGDPEASFSLARVLEKILVAAYPDIRFEIVNAGITAVNSHVVRAVAEDCAKLEPDLFLVFEGNNEVIGPFGPAGVFTPFLRSEPAVRLAGFLKRTRTGQLVAAAGRAFRSGGGRPGSEGDWGGMEMFLQQRIAEDDARLETVRTLFRANLLAIASAGREAGAPTIFCTVPVNVRTFAPFASLHRTDLAASDAERFAQAFAAAEAAVLTGDLTAAEAAFRAARSIDDGHAEVHYRLGQLALIAGRSGEARTLLHRALDLDGLRFRTDTALNAVIRGLPADASVRIVDAAESMAKASPQGLCGDEFFYEHVHLTLRGTYELARVVLPAVIEEIEKRGLTRRGAAPEVLSYDDVRLRLGFTAYEQGMIAAEMLSRLTRAPFLGQSDHRSRLEIWQRRAAAAQALLGRPDALAALRGAMGLALAASPDDWILRRNAGMMLVARGAAVDAVPLLERALAWIDDDADAIAALMLAHRAAGDPEQAEVLQHRLELLEPRHPLLRAAGAPAAQ